MKMFSLDWNYFTFTQMKKYALAGFSEFNKLCCHSACYKFLAGASLHNDFVELHQMQVNIQAVQHNLWRIEQIDPWLYNVNKRRYQTCNTGTRRKEHEQTTTTSQTLFLQLGGTGTRCGGTKFNSCWHFLYQLTWKWSALRGLQSRWVYNIKACL